MAESLRLYAFCKMTKWTHLPIDGGLYDQHPKLIDDFQLIASVENRVEKRNREKEKQQQMKGGKSPRMRR